jgi:hypothetical protein
MGGRPNAKGRKDDHKSYAGIPRIVLDSPDYQNLSDKAARLLLEMARQFRGRNNGDLTAAHSVLKKRGNAFKRQATISKAVNELLAANLIIKTREGRFTNPGALCALYAITWREINDCNGKNLEVKPTVTPPRKFTMEGK